MPAGNGNESNLNASPKFHVIQMQMVWNEDRHATLDIYIYFNRRKTQWVLNISMFHHMSLSKNYD